MTNKQEYKEFLNASDKTEAEEMAIYEFEMTRINKKLAELNRKFKHIQLTKVTVGINRPSPTKAKLWWQFYKK